MKTAPLLLAASAVLAPAFAGYTYDYQSLLNPVTSSQWTANGSNVMSTNLYSSNNSTTGGSEILGPIVPGPNGSYEVRTTLSIPSNASSGSLITYLRATSNSLMATGNTGPYYAVELKPVMSGGVCTATLNIHKQISNTLTTPLHTSIACHSGMVVRSVILGSTAIIIYVDNVWITFWQDTSNQIYSGYPGVGAISTPGQSFVTTIDIGHLDTVAPNPINAQLIGVSPFPNRVDIQFPGDLDDSIGTGVAFYQFLRNGTDIGFSTTPDFSDTTVSAGTTYTYTVQAVDFHYNSANTVITVTTPPAGAIDPRQVGVRSTGTYWGGAGEQIDMRSANLNFTMPLVKILGRGGWSTSFNLSYNSQNWRQDPGGIWQLGRDIGYGYGVRLQAGSLTPVYSGYWTVDHYLFIDSTGAEYHLNVNTGGVWTSQESVYVSFDTTVSLPRLYFPDGSFWTFGSLSAGTEEDAGTMYPTVMQDSNGNQTMINYNAGAGISTTNSSSRINTIEDVRGNGSPDYTFAYSSVGGATHLTGITNSIQTAENYTLTYNASQPLNSPFSPYTSYGTWTFLSTVANGVPLTTTFTYDTSGTGELNKVVFPYGGSLSWNYQPFTYAGSRTLREVTGHLLYTYSGSSPATFPIAFSQTANSNFHASSQVEDAGGVSEKVFLFGTTTGQPSLEHYHRKSIRRLHLDYRQRRQSLHHHGPHHAGLRQHHASAKADHADEGLARQPAADEGLQLRELNHSRAHLHKHVLDWYQLQFAVHFQPPSDQRGNGRHQLHYACDQRLRQCHGFLLHRRLFANQRLGERTRQHQLRNRVRVSWQSRRHGHACGNTLPHL